MDVGEYIDPQQINKQEEHKWPVSQWDYEYWGLGIPKSFSTYLKVSENKKTLQEKYNIKYYKNLNLALKEKPNFAVICSPTSYHLDQTIKCLENNVNVFIEKPLAHNEKN